MKLKPITIKDGNFIIVQHSRGNSPLEMRVRDKLRMNVTYGYDLESIKRGFDNDLKAFKRHNHIVAEHAYRLLQTDQKLELFHYTPQGDQDRKIFTITQKDDQDGTR